MNHTKNHFSQTHYYVQVQDSKGCPETVYHTINKKTKEAFYEFLDRGKAKGLIKTEKKINPTEKHRIVKTTTTFDFGNWE